MVAIFNRARIGLRASARFAFERRYASVVSNICKYKKILFAEARKCLSARRGGAWSRSDRGTRARVIHPARIEVLCATKFETVFRERGVAGAHLRW